MKALLFLSFALSTAVAQAAPSYEVQCTADVMANGETVASKKVSFQMGYRTQERPVFSHAGVSYTFKFVASAAAGPFDALTLTRKDSDGSTAATSMIDQYGVVALTRESKDKTIELVSCQMERKD